MGIELSDVCPRSWDDGEYQNVLRRCKYCQHHCNVSNLCILKTGSVSCLCGSRRSGKKPGVGGSQGLAAISCCVLEQGSTALGAFQHRRECGSLALVDAQQFKLEGTPWDGAGTRGYAALGSSDALCNPRADPSDFPKDRSWILNLETWWGLSGKGWAGRWQRFVLCKYFPLKILKLLWETDPRKRKPGTISYPRGQQLNRKKENKKSREIGALLHCCWECKMGSHFGKQFGSSSKG